MLRLSAPEGRATPRLASAAATAQAAAPTYARHVPERTLLYALVQAHYPDFMARLAVQDRSLPAYVREEFEAFLRCGVLGYGFPARGVRALPCATASGVLLQEARLLPELRRAAHARVGAEPGR